LAKDGDSDVIRLSCGRIVDGIVIETDRDGIKWPPGTNLKNIRSAASVAYWGNLETICIFQRWYVTSLWVGLDSNLFIKLAGAILLWMIE
jgi:hypothetical protein